MVTIGTFDGVHQGHQSILKQVKALAVENGGESVLLTFYPHPRMVLQPELSGLRLLNSPEEKARLLEAAGIDHLVVYPFSESFSRLPAEEYVRDLLVVGIGVKKLVVGYDHRFGRNREGDIRTLFELAEIFGFSVVEIPAQRIDEIKISSTKIRNALAEGDIASARQGLGYDYPVTGTVVKGSGRGADLGFPTANVLPSYPMKLIPARGVYAVFVHHFGKKSPAIMNIGVRPTVTSDNVEVIEVHIPGVAENLYGEIITMDFVERIRDEQKFGSIDALKNQIALDRTAAEKIFARHRQ